jgi:hypothetical protein
VLPGLQKSQSEPVPEDPISVHAKRLARLLLGRRGRQPGGEIPL